METGSQDEKTPRPTMREAIKALNEFISLKGEQMKILKREKEIEKKNQLVAAFVEAMRSNGASDRSIQKALPGLYEFAKFSISKRRSGNQAPDKSENPQPAPDSAEEMLSFFLSEVETQEVHWLWEKRVPLGKITLLDGDPGMGKSLLAINLAACISTGRPMPDGTPAKQGGVILVAPEDGAADTLRPRLEAAGGDPSHVLLMNIIEDLDAKKVKVSDRPFSLSHDLEKLEGAIKRTKAVLVILDPLTAILGHNIDASRDQDVREVFTPLAQMAERTNCAILIIRHLSKGASVNALYRGAGSIGIIAAARLGLLVAQDPYDENRRVLATTKNNLSLKAANLSYKVVGNASGIPYIQWLGENNYTLPTLLDGETSMSLERQKILQALKDAAGPLSPQQVAELTGQKYTSAKLTLNRMLKAGEIARSHRGMYTTLDHPSLLHKRTGNNTGTTATADTTDTLVTSDTTDTTDTSVKIVPLHANHR